VGSFLIGAEDIAKSIADFSERRIGAHRIENSRHGIFGARSGMSQGGQRISHALVVATLSQAA
jgi:hypothetical protein